MSMNDELQTIIDEVDVLVTELHDLYSTGPHFRILHRFHEPFTTCAVGEEIAGVYLVYRGQEVVVRLSLALRLLFDYLARHCRLPQSAMQIEAGMRADHFYTDHASAGIECGKGTRKIPRSYIRVYIDRLRSALEIALREIGLTIDVRHVLLSQKTVMNEVGYQLKATFEWIHLDLVDQDVHPNG